MKFDPNKDFYRVLEVESNASQDEIEKQHRLLMLVWHPDRFPSSESKAKAEEKCKQINEAYDVLSDPGKRKAYDDDRGSAPTTAPGHSTAASAPTPPAPKPEIVFSTTTLNFGTVTKGDDGTKSFTIENHGDFPDAITIKWDPQPAWAKPLDIETTPITIFPITVTVELKTGRITPDSYATNIVVTADGEVFTLPVRLKVVAPKVAPASPSPTPAAAPAPRPRPSPAPRYTAPAHRAPSTPTNVPWGGVGCAFVVIAIVIAIVAYNAHQSNQNDLVSANVALATGTGKPYGYTFLNLRVRNDSDSAKGVLFNITLQFANGYSCPSITAVGGNEELYLPISSHTSDQETKGLWCWDGGADSEIPVSISSCTYKVDNSDWKSCQ